MEEILTRKPFEAKRLEIVPEDEADLVAIASYFELADEDKGRLSACLSWPHEPGVSFVTTESGTSLRRSLGFVRLNEPRPAVLIFEKEAREEEGAARRAFVIDSYELAAVRSTAESVLREDGVTRPEDSRLAQRDTNEHWFGLRLLRKALALCSPSYPIIADAVAGLPPHRMEQLAELLKETDLSSMIGACRTVVNRLRFLADLELRLLSSDRRATMCEETQLHSILAENTWLVGEEYNLMTDDDLFCFNGCGTEAGSS